MTGLYSSEISVFAEAMLLATAAKESCAVLVVIVVPVGNANFTLDPEAPKYLSEETIEALFLSCVMILEKREVESVEIEVCVVE